MRLERLLPKPALVFALVALFSTSACSRLTFVRPASKVEAYQPSRSAYQVSDNAGIRQRREREESLQLAAQRLQAGDLATAAREARRVLKAEPDSAMAHTLLAVVEQHEGRQARAGEHYRRAAELVPSDGGMLNNYGAWLCANGYPAEALVWFDRALDTPGYATPAAALANAGGCALRTGQFERAGRDLRRALELEPGNAYALGAMAESEYRQGRYFEARAFIERRLGAAKASADVLQLAANIETSLGDKAAADRYLRRLRAEFPEAATSN